MFIFSKYILNFLGFLVLLILFTPLFLRMKGKKERIKDFEIYYVLVGFIVLCFSALELVIYSNIRDKNILLIFHIEMTCILLLCNILFYLVQKDSHDDYIPSFYTVIVILFSHVMISGIFFPFLIMIS